MSNSTAMPSLRQWMRSTLTLCLLPSRRSSRRSRAIATRSYVADPSPRPTRGRPHLEVLLTWIGSACSGPPCQYLRGFLSEGLPQGLQILGRAWDEAKIIRYAYAYEQATHHRRPPPTVPPLANVRDAERRGR